MGPAHLFNQWGEWIGGTEVERGENREEEEEPDERWGEDCDWE